MSTETKDKTPMKSNEEIIRNDFGWDYAADPGRYQLFCQLISPAMDEARREAAIGFAEWIMTRFYSGNDGTWHEDTAPDISRSYTTSELYNLYLKNKTT